MNLREDKEQLLQKTLSKFDGNITVEDVTDGATTPSYSSHSHTLFVQVLIEQICRFVEPNENVRDILFHEVLSRLIQSSYVNDYMNLDDLMPLRRTLADKFFTFVKQIQSEIVPNACGSNLTVDSLLEDQKFSSKLKFQNKYEQNFEELQVIAKGGFGVVCKAKHKIDGIVYAVKKIIFKYRNDSDYLKVIREAKSIATLNHPNVVSYNNAWIECLKPSDTESENSSSGSSTPEEHCPVVTANHFSDGSRILSTVVRKDMSLSAVNNFMESFEPKIYESISEGVNEKKYGDPDDDSCYKSAGLSHNKTLWRFSELNVKVMLCIQMEYCDCDLRLWLDRRAKGQELPFEKNVMDIFKEILHGVAHVHSKNIIHRDLKPQNVFYSRANNAMKVGDFGLATLIDYSSDSISDGECSRYSANLGTIPYAAPEQISRSVYDSKVDMYSLGIILIELLCCFTTQMELCCSINEILKGIFPKEMQEKWPKHIFLVKNLVRRNPKCRMSAKEILNQPLLQDRAQADEIKVLKEALIEKDRHLSEKDEALCQKDREIQELKAILQEKLCTTVKQNQEKKDEKSVKITS